MQTGVTETIWHFAGYLHLIDEVARSWTLYDDEPPVITPDRLPAMGRPLPHAPDVEPTFSQPSPFWAVGSQPIFPEPMLLLRGMPNVDVRRVELGPIDLPQFSVSLPTGGGSMTLSYRARIERQDAHGETVAEVRQLNVLDDSDTYVWGEDVASDLLSIDPAQELLDLLDVVEEATPDAFVPPAGQDAFAVALLARHDAMKAGETDPNLDDHVAGEGRFVDGEEVDEEWEYEGLGDPPQMPDAKNGHEAAGAHAQLGANEAANAAIVQDLNELSLQTVVFGDWYKLNTIVQINVLADADEIESFGGRFDGLVSAIVGSGTGEASRLTNIAEYLEKDVDFGALELPGRGGMKWTVDVLDGDFWDLKATYQTNWIVDDDVYSKTSYDLFSQVRMGENLSVNLLDFFQAAGDYDLIVIGGNYYGANWIVQANVLLDTDALLVGHEAGLGRQTLSSGGNELLNDALIATYGGGTMVALGSDLAAFLPKLMGEDSLDPAEWWAVNGIGSGAMRVLWVTGDYYDVNLLSQLNVVSDADSLAQILPFYATHGGDGAEQWIATGGNRLANTAIIVDTEAAVATHVGGGIYEEDFLVQAEIVIDGDDYAEDGLAPELVAFTGGEDMPFDDDGLFGTGPLAGQGDMMGSVMT